MTMGNSERRAAARILVIPEDAISAAISLLGRIADGYTPTDDERWGYRGLKERLRDERRRSTDAASAAAGVRISKTTAQRAMDGIKDAIGLATNARDGNIDPGLQRVFNEQWEAYSEIRDAIRAAESAEASGEETGHD